jgi:hypothetical protein
MHVVGEFLILLGEELMSTSMLHLALAVVAGILIATYVPSVPSAIKSVL